MSTPVQKVMVTGAGGQLGQTLCASVPNSVQVRGVTRAELDIGDLDGVRHVIAEFAPDVVINAAAYTAVDKAETDQSAAEVGNVIGPKNLAIALRERPQARLIHLSTDFVFDGKQSTPYRPDSQPAPLGVYGRSKLEGERAVLEVLGERAAIVRTAWVYAAHGKNFLNTMLRLMREKGVVRVVTDQVGTPTCTHSLSEVLWRLALQPPLSGIYHWTDAGVASWYDFAVAIAEEAFAMGLLAKPAMVVPIASHEFPTPVERPAYSVLDKTATHATLQLPAIHWRQRLREVLVQRKELDV